MSMKLWTLAFSTMALVFSVFAAVGGGGCAEYMCGTNHNQVLV